jgi:hypothetical protein
MKNPCDQCIVKVNCTEICPDKENYLTLLEDAQLKFRGKYWDRNFRGQYRQLEEHSLRCRIDMHKIKSRRRKLKGE